MYVATDQEVLDALSLVIPALRAGNGHMPGLKYPAIREAFRVLNLHSEDGVWYETCKTWTPLLSSAIDLENPTVIRDHAAFKKLRKPPKLKAPNYEVRTMIG
jgi:hypothetical protein